MYLKNTTKTSQFALRTKKGLFIVNPGEVLEVQEYELLNPIKSLKEITKEEFLRVVKKEINQEENSAEVEEKPVTDIKENLIVDAEDNKQTLVKDSAETIQEVNKDIKVKSNKSENKREKKQARKKMTSKDLTGQLEELKQKWLSTKNAKEKETIQKQIKELQAKLDKE